MKKAPVLKILALLKKIKPIHYLAIAIVIAIGIFNGVTGVMPHINQARYEKGIVKSFNRWWNEEGAERFKSIGLEPTEKIKQEEFEQFRERALSLKPSYISRLVGNQGRKGSLCRRAQALPKRGRLSTRTHHMGRQLHRQVHPLPHGFCPQARTLRPTAYKLDAVSKRLELPCIRRILYLCIRST